MLARKLANIERLKPDVIAAGNIGCITQLAAGTTTPVVHTIELLDWATGGPMPEPLATVVKAPAALAAAAGDCIDTTGRIACATRWP